MKIINHGKWVAYKPEKLPYGAPPNAMFCKREDDGQDWYEFVNSGKNLGEASVKMSVMWHDYAGSLVVGPAVHDATKLFPANQYLLEIVGFDGEDPQTHFGGKLYDLLTEKFTDQPPPTPMPDLYTLIEELRERVTKLEARNREEPNG